MRIPEVRERLLVIADEMLLENADLEALSDYIRMLVGELYRRQRSPKRSPKAKPMSRKLKKAIKDYAEKHPDMLQREVGLVFGVDGGRVHEALYGKRT